MKNQNRHHEAQILIKATPTSLPSSRYAERLSYLLSRPKGTRSSKQEGWRGATSEVEAANPKKVSKHSNKKQGSADQSKGK